VSAPFWSKAKSKIKSGRRAQNILGWRVRDHLMEKLESESLVRVDKRCVRHSYVRDDLRHEQRKSEYKQTSLAGHFRKLLGSFDSFISRERRDKFAQDDKRSMPLPEDVFDFSQQGAALWPVLYVGQSFEFL
jgi:hypothetical protein